MRCGFCGIRSIPEEIKHMTVNTAIQTAKAISVFDPVRIEIGIRGEPTLNPDIFKIVAVLRKYNPQSYILVATNGVKLTADWVKNYFSAGGNVVFVDTYGKTYNKLFSKLREFNPVDYYEDDFNPYHKHPPGIKKVVLVRDISEMDGVKRTRIVFNLAGNVNWEIAKEYGLEPLKEPVNKRCTYPFRQIDVGWDGGIQICCVDWRQETTIWHVKYGQLKEYWRNNHYLNMARYLLFHKNRDFAICRRCDFYGGHRHGLIRDMGEYNEETANQFIHEWDELHKKNLEAKPWLKKH